MFLNLGQAKGPAVILTVGTFVERYDLLDAPKDKGGPGAGGKIAGCSVRSGSCKGAGRAARRWSQAMTKATTQGRREATRGRSGRPRDS